ncbi:MAG: hypothetical protein Q9183_007241 [Haloplaca sp. 2 TL-2023]
MYVVRLSHYLFHLLLHLLPRSSLAQLQGAFHIYLDPQCNQASAGSPYVSYPNTCFVTPGALGIADTFSPSCASYQTAQLLTYRDSSCSGEPDDLDDVYLELGTNCYSNGQEGIGAIQFGCGDAGGDDVATTTQTIRVGSSTGAPTGGGRVGTGSGGDSDDDEVDTSSRVAGSPTPTPTPVSNDDDQGNDSGSDGLSAEGEIAVGVVIPALALIVAFLAWKFPQKRKKVLGR